MAFFGLTTSSSKKKEQNKRKSAEGEVRRMRDERLDDTYTPHNTASGATGAPSLEGSAHSMAQNGPTRREQAIANAQAQQQRASQARTSGQQEAMGLFEKYGQRGLTPERETQLRGSANRRIGEDVAGAQEELIAKQGSRGVKGGAAFAQAAHLQGQGQKAKAMAGEEVNRLSADAALKKLALALTRGEGAAGEQYLGEESELNRLENDDERRYMNEILKQIHRNFNLVG